jgi:putative DNA methylase
MNKTKYFQGGIKSEGHTPIYKMHKYFARRPHNVFRALIEQYCPEGGLVVDCFGGGGVTLIEGLTAKRRVISYDINPIASFVQYAQTLEVSEDRVRELANIIQNGVSEAFGTLYSTSCRDCGDYAHVRWFEHAYRVSCPHCEQHTFLDNDSKKISSSGKRVDGSYSCNQCGGDIRAANVPRVGSKILNLRYRCGACGSHKTVTPNSDDLLKFSKCIENEALFVDRYHLEIPDDSFPVYWDRQKEDCLSRKGFKKFRDLFTSRNLLCSAKYFSELDALRTQCTSDEWYFMLLNISALMRYTNNMTFSVNSWMDGRPVAWAKHAYWTPNQFVECNPMEYFDNRIKAAVSGVKDRRTRFTNVTSSFSEIDVVEKRATHAIRSASSDSMNLRDESVDVVVTDPPYGSNVQYGELCHFWLVWLKNKLPFACKTFELNDEVVVHRKKDPTSNYPKTFDDYRLGLTSIYRECFRVLKLDGVLVFTFNNKNPDAWFAVIKAALDAGFDLEPEGITYQEQIDAYRDTAHLRFDGTAQGDFIYSFVKRKDSLKSEIPTESLDVMIGKCIDATINVFALNKETFSEAQLFVSAYKRILSTLVAHIKNGSTESEIIQALDFSTVLKTISNRPEFSHSGNMWNVLSQAI